MSELSNTTAVILAGGLGTRLRTVVPDRPKVLAEVRGRPFIEYLLDQLSSEGVETVILCTGHLAEQVQNRLGVKYQKMTLRYSREHEPLGTGGALRLAAPIIESDPVLVLNGDSHCDARLDDFAAWHRVQNSSATIMLAQMDDTRRYGRVQIDEAGRVERFEEKTETASPGWVNAGVYLLNREVITSIPESANLSLEKAVFPCWIGRGLHGFHSAGRLWDIGVPEAYALAQTEFGTSTQEPSE